MRPEGAATGPEDGGGGGGGTGDDPGLAQWYEACGLGLSSSGEGRACGEGPGPVREGDTAPHFLMRSGGEVWLQESILGKMKGHEVLPDYLRVVYFII
jgi:hypothetical protein